MWSVEKLNREYNRLKESGLATRKLNVSFLDLLRRKSPDTLSYLEEKSKHCLNVPRATRFLVEVYLKQDVCCICNEQLTHPYLNNVCALCGATTNGAKVRAQNIRRKIEDSCLAKFGVRHHLQSTEVLTKRAKTNLMRYGHEVSCHGRHLNRQEVLSRISESAKHRWQDPAYRKKYVRRLEAKYGKGTTTIFKTTYFKEKRVATLIERLGVDSPMRDRQVLLKALAKSHLVHSVTLDRKKFRVQGKSELALLPVLVARYGAAAVQTQFSKKFPSDSLHSLKTTPDFYVSSCDAYVECKSVWTFMGRPGPHPRSRLEGNLKQNKRKARVSNESAKVRWMVHFKLAKQDRFILLPLTWFSMSCVEIRRAVNSVTKSGESHGAFLCL